MDLKKRYKLQGNIKKRSVLVTWENWPIWEEMVQIVG